MVGGKIQGENRGKNSKFLDDAKRSGKVGRDTHRYVERSHPRSPAHDFIKGYNGYERRKGRKETKKKKKLAGSRKGGWREGKGREEKAARWGSPAGTNNGRQNAVGHPLPSFLKRREIGPGTGDRCGRAKGAMRVTVKISDLSGQR